MRDGDYPQSENDLVREGVPALSGPNELLRQARESLSSRTMSGRHMGRPELAEAVNAWLWRETGKHYTLDAHTVARYERGAVRWPSAPYREALRAILRVETDAELGFYPTPHVNTGRKPGSDDENDDHTLGQPTLLKELLVKRHLQSYRAFCRAYHKAAETLEKEFPESYPPKRLTSSQPSQRQFYRWMSGEVRGLPYPDNCSVLETMFPGYSARELFEPVTNRPKNTVDSREYSPGTVRIVHVVADPMEWEMWDRTQRRNFLMQAAGTVATVLTGLDRSLDKSPPRLPAGYSDRFDEETFEGLEQATLGLRRAYRSTGAPALLGPSYGTLNLLTEMAPRAGKHQDRVVTTIGQTAALIGIMLSLDLGDFGSGQRYLAVAVRAAHQAGNNDLLAFSLGARAFQAAYGGDPRGGRDYADSALNIAERGISSVTHGWLCAVASEMHAIDGDEVICRQLLDDAATHLANADPAEPWTGVGIFNADKLMAYLGGDLMRLGRYCDAQEVLHRSLNQLDPSLAKHRCTAYVDLAEAYAADGKMDEAADNAINAISIVADTRHAQSLRRVERLYEKIRPRKSDATRRLGEELVGMRATW